MPPRWTTVWRLDRTTMNPERVRIMDVGESFVLVEGESHTSYKGGFFRSPEEAFKDAEDDARRSIRYGQERIDRIARARERFDKTRRDAA